MRSLTLTLLAATLAAVPGCPKPQEFPHGIESQATANGLTLELTVPRREFVRGETLPVTVVAHNRSGKEMTINAGSGALVYVSVFHRTPAGWELVKRYPQTAAPLASPWRLARGGSSAPLRLDLPVEPDWPTGEPLKLLAELNGRPEPKVFGIVHVFRTREECDRARVH
jgi:hypothetical protein